MDNSWEASDIFDVIRRLINDSSMNEREKTMAHALVDAHGSQYVANTELFDRKLAIHGQMIGLPPGSPAEKRALNG